MSVLFPDKPQMPRLKTEQLSASTDDEVKEDGMTRLLKSEHLTLEMTVNYLYNVRKKSKLTHLLLQKLGQLCSAKSFHYIPTIVFILTLEYQEQFFKFCEYLAKLSLPLYMMVRWSFTAYQGQKKNLVENLKNKLDSALLGKVVTVSEDEICGEKLKQHIVEKQNHQNYISVLNEFYDKLFKIPEKLRKYEKPKRNQKLKGYLTKIFDSFMKEQNGYLNGIVFPVNKDSSINVRIVKQQCMCFSTKERVPFKLVFESISYEDAMQCKNGIFPKRQQPVETQKQRKSLILPSSYFGQLWQDTEAKIKSTSPYSSIPSYKIQVFMIKSGDDLRQQYMAMQLIKLIEDISKRQNIQIWLRPYDVVPFNGDSGLIQFVNNTKTVSYLKQKSKEKSLNKVYQQMFGTKYEQAINNFLQSLAGYSLVQYILQIKDRHNNNILVDTQGHIIHIDFSFILSSSPGNMNFQKAPFKFTQDYLEMMQGLKSPLFAKFRTLFYQGLKMLRKYKKQIIETVTMMSHCDMKCFQKFDKAEMEKIFHENATDKELEAIVSKIVSDASTSFSTGGYDRYQWYTNFIYS